MVLKNGSINFSLQLSRNFHRTFLNYHYCEAKTPRNVTKVTQQIDFMLKTLMQLSRLSQQERGNVSVQTSVNCCCVARYHF